MIRAAFLICVTLVGPAQAAEWFCQSRLKPGAPPRSAVEFHLTLDDAGVFQAQGRRDNRGFGWEGHYARFDGGLALIGSLDAAGDPIETRAMSQDMRDTVLILTMQEAQAQPLMIRCLRHDLR